MRKSGIAIVSVLAGAMLLAGCGPYVSPCESLPAPTAEQLRVAQGAEVEIEVRGVDCQLVVATKTWDEESEM
jgi:uncharacterized lipoprotein YajG